MPGRRLRAGGLHSLPLGHASLSELTAKKCATGGESSRPGAHLMRTIVSASVAAALLLVASGASALERTAVDMRKNQGIMVAVAVTPLSEATEAPEPPSPPKDTPNAAAAAKKASPTGAVFDFGMSGGALGGSLAEGIDLGGFLGGFELRAGGYVSEHVGIIGGLSAGTGSLGEGCAAKCNNVFHYALPVVVQYAFEDRTRGAYVETGFKLLPTVKASSGDGGGESLAMSGLLDVKLGVGYRIPVAVGALDLRAGFDFGEFNQIKYESLAGSVEGEIVEERRALHYVASLGVGWHFAP